MLKDDAFNASISVTRNIANRCLRKPIIPCSRVAG